MSHAQRNDHANDIKLLHQLSEIFDACLNHERTFEFMLQPLDEHWRESGRNLLHYLKFRTFDLRELHDQLSFRGLSSLRCAEAHTLDNLKKVIYLLCLKTKRHWHPCIPHTGFDFYSGRQRIEYNTQSLLGFQNKSTRIMVTFPHEEADNLGLIRELRASGMNCVRINCAHGSHEDWQKVIHNIQAEFQAEQQNCHIHFDLAGPKIRCAAFNNDKEHLKLHSGDEINLVFSPEYLANTSKPTVYIDSPELFDQIQPGDPVIFSDGKFNGLVIARDSNQRALEVRMERCDNTKKLHLDKGVNFPHSALTIASLTAKDYQDLTCLAPLADSVGLSFVRSEADIALLQDTLHKNGWEHLGLIAKIETQKAVDNLPRILFQLMQSKKIGVMLARGDLSVEIGFERTAEIQEELLWFCEAAHIPTIWATQVLQNHTKKGLATRAEITDAAMAGRAECVMLNTGPYLSESVKMLTNILYRMNAHRHKKYSLMRPLAIAGASLRDEMEIGEELIGVE